jgi:hypothetical protein
MEAPMPELHDIAGKLAGVLGLIAYIPYIYSTVKRRTKPNPASWFIWIIVSVMVIGSSYATGATTTLTLLICHGVGTVTTAIVAVKYGKSQWSIFDKACLAIALSSSIVWWFFSALAALLLNIGIEMVGFLPTLRNAYRDPKSEDKLAWILFLSANTANLIAINDWSFAIFIYPLCMFLGTVLIIALMLIPKKKTS